MSPAASQEILHHTAWRTWLFISYSDSLYSILTIHLYISLWKVGRMYFKLQNVFCVLVGGGGGVNETRQVPSPCFLRKSYYRDTHSRDIVVGSCPEVDKSFGTPLRQNNSWKSSVAIHKHRQRCKAAPNLWLGTYRNSFAWQKDTIDLVTQEKKYITVFWQQQINSIKSISAKRKSKMEMVRSCCSLLRSRSVPTSRGRGSRAAAQETGAAVAAILITEAMIGQLHGYVDMQIPTLPSALSTASHLSASKLL